jgi:hypothetical protein
MHQQHATRGKVRQEIFGAAADAGNGLACEPFFEIIGQRPAQIRPPCLDPQDARTLNHRRKPAADRLDLGKLRHLELLFKLTSRRRGLPAAQHQFAFAAYRCGATCRDL